MPKRPTLRTTAVPVADLIPHPENARQGDVGAIAESIDVNGVFRPLIVSAATMHVLDGNHTLAALQALGHDQVDVVLLPDLTVDQERRILVAANRTADLADYNTQGLVDLLAVLAASDSGLAGTGFDGDDVDDLLVDLAEDQPFGEFDKDDRYTPQWIFDKLGVTFDLDPASPPGGSNVPCRRYYTEADDGLAQPWEGTVWLNPPFSNNTKWVERFIEHGNGIYLGPMSVNTPWTTALMAISTYIWIPRRNVEFDTPHPNLSGGIGFPIYLASIGDHAEALLNLADDGQILAPVHPSE